MVESLRLKRRKFLAWLYKKKFFYALLCCLSPFVWFALLMFAIGWEVPPAIEILWMIVFMYTGFASWMLLCIWMWLLIVPKEIALPEYYGTPAQKQRQSIRSWKKENLIQKSILIALGLVIIKLLKTIAEYDISDIPYLTQTYIVLVSIIIFSIVLYSSNRNK